MTGSLARSSCLVTGGGSGIGRAAVRAYLAQGAHVTVLERSARSAEELAAELGDRGRVLTGDATDPERLAEAVAVAAGAGRPVAQLTCCVGVFDGYASVRELSAADLCAAGEEIWRTNVLGTLLAVHAAWPWLRAGSGSITLTASESAFHPVGGGVLYGSSKWALRGVVCHLAKDLAPEVRVNAVAPGGTAGTSFSGTRSLGQQPVDSRAGRDERIRAGNVLGVLPAPEDHAGAFLFLADPVAARVVTGMVIGTDGGRR